MQHRRSHTTKVHEKRGRHELTKSRSETHETVLSNEGYSTLTVIPVLPSSLLPLSVVVTVVILQESPEQSPEGGPEE